MTRTASDNIDYNVLIIDTDTNFAEVSLRVFAQRGLHGTVAADRKNALDYADRNIWKLVFINNEFAPDQSLVFLRRLRQANPELPVIMTSISNSAKTALSAVRAGFTEFLTRPVAPAAIHDLLDRFVPNHRTSIVASAYTDSRCVYKIVGAGPALKKTIELAKKVAPFSVPVLITGPSGTGKELVAQFIHAQSRRAHGPFVKINCAALSDSLLESELFGHEKGAFTGASELHRGRFERAHGGTLLLDEITETAPRFQAQLLRVLEQMNMERVGGSECININVRIISTTNKNIQDEIRRGQFRCDLYYRLAGVRLAVPSLSRRPEDIMPLVWHFINEFAYEAQRSINSIDPQMTDVFAKYHWPGNVRQLRNVIRTAMILGSGKSLSLSDVPWLIDELSPEYSMERDDGLDVAGSLEELEKKAILATLRRTSGNRSRAARVLGISDRTLRDKVKKYCSGRLQESVQCS